MRSLRWPLEGALVSSGYGARRHPILGGTRRHGGVDLPAPSGTPVRAAADGIVRYFGRNGSYGRFIRLDHGFGLETAYGHLRRYALSLRRQARVRRGEVIGYVGSSGLATGPHLHYEFLVNGTHRNPRTIELPKAEPIAADEREQFLVTTNPVLTTLASHRERHQLALSGDAGQR